MNIADSAEPGAGLAIGDADSIALQQFARIAARLLDLPIAVFSLAAQPKGPERKLRIECRDGGRCRSALQCRRGAG